MIEIENLSYHVPLPGGGRKTLFDHQTLVLPTRGAIGLLGRNGAGKSTFLQLIAGLIAPHSGRVRVRGAVSWPVGFSGSFHPELSGAQNLRFAARLYGRDPEALVRECESFAKLGPELHAPVHSYSSGMRSRLAFALSLAIPFDLYLVDEVTAVGDLRFREKSRQRFMERMQRAGAIMVDHNLIELSRMCRSGLLLEGGVFTYYPQIEDAISAYRALLAPAQELSATHRAPPAEGP